MKKVMYAVKGADGQVFKTANEMLIKARRKAQGRG